MPTVTDAGSTREIVGEFVTIILKTVVVVSDEFFKGHTTVGADWLVFGDHLKNWLLDGSRNIRLHALNWIPTSDRCNHSGILRSM
jgi:hypothetical protein